MKQKRNARKFIVGLLTLSLLGTGGFCYIPGSRIRRHPSPAKLPRAGKLHLRMALSCKPGDTTPPPWRLVAKTPKGKLKNPSHRISTKVAERWPPPIHAGRAVTNVTAVLAAEAFARPYGPKGSGSGAVTMTRCSGLQVTLGCSGAAK